MRKPACLLAFLLAAAAVARAQPQPVSTEDQVVIGADFEWKRVTLPACSNATTSKLLYDATANLFSCGTDQSAAGTGAPRTIVELGGALANNVFTAAPVDDCGAIATNLGTAFKRYGPPTTVTMDGFTSARLNCRMKEGAAQVGTISCQIKDLTDSAVLVGPVTSTSATCATATASVTVALTGQHTVACEVKTTNATDDPAFSNCTLELSP